MSILLVAMLINVDLCYLEIQNGVDTKKVDLIPKTFQLIILIQIIPIVIFFCLWMLLSVMMLTVKMKSIKRTSAQCMRILRVCCIKVVNLSLRT